MSIIERYKKMLFGLFPDELKKQLAQEKGTTMDGIVNLLFASIPVVILALLGLAVQMVVLGGLSMLGGMNEVVSESPVFSEYPALAALLEFGSASSILARLAWIVVGIPVVIVAVALLSTLVTFILAKLLGGTGTFSEQFFQFSYPNGGKTVIQNILRIIPCIGPILEYLLEIFYLYPAFIIYKRVHKLSDARAALLVAIPIIVLMLIAIVMFILAAAMVVALIGAISGAASAASP